MILEVGIMPDIHYKIKEMNSFVKKRFEIFKRRMSVLKAKTLALAHLRKTFGTQTFEEWKDFVGIRIGKRMQYWVDRWSIILNKKPKRFHKR